MSTLAGVIFDYSCIFIDTDDDLLNELRDLLGLIKSAKLKLIIFTTNPQPINETLKRLNFPAADLILTEQDVGKRKGSPEWVYEAARQLNVKSHRLLFVGDDARDWRSAINSATMYLHAKWVDSLPERVTAIVAERPPSVWRFISHFLLPPPRWEYALNLPEYDIYVRSLLGSSVRLPATKTEPATSPPSFTLQDIFTYDNKAQVGPYRARDLLMLHAITSLYLEGLIHPKSFFAVYPSSTPGKKSPVLREFLRPVAKLFHGFFKEDLLVRAIQAVDSSMEKALAKRENRLPRIPETNQSNTVHIHSDFRNNLRGRSIIVFDDFTTTGQSLEWARNLLYVAGASQVILLTIGKYPKPYVIHELKTNGVITPFQRNEYDLKQLFNKIEITLSSNIDARQMITSSFNHWTVKKPLPS